MSAVGTQVNNTSRSVGFPSNFKTAKDLSALHWWSLAWIVGKVSIPCLILHLLLAFKVFYSKGVSLKRIWIFFSGPQHSCSNINGCTTHLHIMADLTPKVPSLNIAI